MGIITTRSTKHKFGKSKIYIEGSIPVYLQERCFQKEFKSLCLHHYLEWLAWNNQQTNKLFSTTGGGTESLGLALPSVGTPTVTQLVFFGDNHALCNQKLLTLKSGKLVTSIQWRWGSERWNTESRCSTKWRHTDSHASCLFWVETSFV